MRQFKPNAIRRPSAAGFSLVELLVVVAIIGAMAAVGLPAIGRYIRNFRIKAATQQVATEINVARSKAIMKNVNLGVLFAVVSNTQYRWVVEDDQDPDPLTPSWSGYGTEDWSILTGTLAKSQAGNIQSLPQNVVFDDPSNCGVSSGTNTWAVRFTQLGSTCALGTGTCGAAPQNPPTGTALITALNGVHTVCLKENTTNLRKKVAVSSGGRVLADQ
jgi:prepilin-type N-terminal cleavage/methylation domain-containing protein